MWHDSKDESNTGVEFFPAPETIESLPADNCALRQRIADLFDTVCHEA